MDQSVANIKSYFSKAKRKANARLKPFVGEMETISIKRAKGVISDAQANVKMRACCSKNGINPSVIDNSYFEASGLKMSGPTTKALDFNPRKRGVQSTPSFNFKNVGVDFNNKKPNKQSTPKLDLPQMGFKPVNLFNTKKQTKKSKNVGLPNFNIKMPAQKHKMHQGRFGSFDLFKAPGNNKELMIKPIFPNKKKKTKKKSLINIKPLKFKGLF